jgi:hypothetical protein
MQDRPSAAELIAAVAAFLEGELLPTLTDQRLRFRGLVAANVLAVVARELEAGDAPIIAECRRLALLLGEAEPGPAGSQALAEQTLALEGELCRRIRAGAFDAPQEFAAALQHAEAMLVEKLRIANPRYLARLGRN